MTRIEVSQVIEAPVSIVWQELADIAGHVEWMLDAASITFTSESLTGVGTTFDCVTQVGPFSIVDRMEVVDWREGHEIAVRHKSLVTGVGVFALHPHPTDSQRTTTLYWREHLRFPWYLGGPIAGMLAKPILRRIWRGNLHRLAELINPRQ